MTVPSPVATTAPRPCSYCGETIQRPRRAQQKFCSPSCQQLAQRRGIGPAELELIERWASKGVSEKTIASELPVAWPTWRALKVREPAVAAALARGRAREEDALVGALFHQATEKGSVAAACFLLKARHGYCDQQPAGPPEANRVQITFQLPAALSREQYQQIVDVTPRKALAESGVNDESH